jgi:hypothetical protein
MSAHRTALYIAVGIAIVAVAFWLSPRNHPSPKVAAPPPVPIVQTAPMVPDDPRADVG